MLFSQKWQLCLYTVSHKTIPNIFDCNLKKDYGILVFFVWVFLTQLAIKWPFNFLPRPKSVSALPGERRTNKIFQFCPRQCYYLIKIIHKNMLSTFLSLWLTVHPTDHFFATAYSKNVQNVSPLCELRMETLSPFVDSSVDNILLHTNPDFTSRFLNSSIFLNVIW